MSSRPDPMTHLADDRTRAVDESTACSSIWPLLAVPGDALDALDRETRDVHLDGCARCRAVAAEVWIDGEVAPPSEVRASLPKVVTLAKPRRSGRRKLAWLSGALAAAAAVAMAVVVPAALDEGDVRVIDQAEMVRPHDPDPPFALVVLVQGTESWMGNEQYVPTDAGGIAGHHHDLAIALADLSAMLPPRSVVSVLSTSTLGTRIELPMGPAANLTSTALGTQQHYQGQAGPAGLIDAYDLALDLLRNKRGYRHAVVIVGDGCTVDPQDPRQRDELGIRNPFERRGVGGRGPGHAYIHGLLLAGPGRTWEAHCVDDLRRLGVSTPRRASAPTDLAPLLQLIVDDIRNGR